MLESYCPLMSGLKVKNLPLQGTVKVFFPQFRPVFLDFKDNDCSLKSFSGMCPCVCLLKVYRTIHLQKIVTLI